jgi:hypothetical protein
MYFYRILTNLKVMGGNLLKESKRRFLKEILYFDILLFFMYRLFIRCLTQYFYCKIM